MRFPKSCPSVSDSIRTMRLITLVLAALTLMGCAFYRELTSPTTGAIPDGIVEVSAPANYAALWAKVEHCSGLSRPMTEIHWFQVPGVVDFPYNGARTYGLYQYPNRITLAQMAGEWDDHVEHEILHALLAQLKLKEDHPAEYFKVKCGFVAQNPVLNPS